VGEEVEVEVEVMEEGLQGMEDMAWEEACSPNPNPNPNSSPSLIPNPSHWAFQLM
jgi:hypothetical protein